MSPEDEILTKVQECQTPISFERGVLVLFQELVILLSFVVLIVEILRKIISDRIICLILPWPSLIGHSNKH